MNVFFQLCVFLDLRIPSFLTFYSRQDQPTTTPGSFMTSLLYYTLNIQLQFGFLIDATSLPAGVIKYEQTSTKRKRNVNYYLALNAVELSHQDVFGHRTMQMRITETLHWLHLLVIFLYCKEKLYQNIT